MIGGAQTFQINEPSIVSETIDGEVVIINLDKGSYYSLRGSGALIWGHLHEQNAVDDILRGVNDLYEGDSEQMLNVVSNFLSELVEEEIIRLANDNSQSTHARFAESDPSGQAAEKQPFEAPVLEKFTDMEHLLLLDPIHEVDETGWPHEK